MDVESEDKVEEQLVARSYQTQLEEIAVKRNTIIHLPTGSGKTFIALELIKRLSSSLKKPWGEGGKRTFFLVNTVSLVYQQKNVIEELCPVDGVGAYSSEEKVDYWKKDKWDKELNKYQVIVMTCQILCDMLQHTYIRIQDINLLIFDECHHAVENHPMRLIMKYFESCPLHEQPRVLGLTATLLNANVAIGKIVQTIKDLETTMYSTISTVNSMGEVAEFSTNPLELMLVYKISVPTPGTVKAIKILDNLIALVMCTKLPSKTGSLDSVNLQRGQINISEDCKKVIKQIKNNIIDTVDMIETLGAYGGTVGIMAYIILFERLKRNALKEFCLLLQVVITNLVLAQKYLENSMHYDKGFMKIQKHSSDQVIKLLDTLKEYNPDIMKRSDVILSINTQKKALCGIIFTKKRFMAKVLYNILKEVVITNPQEFAFLKQEFVVGLNMNPFKCTVEDLYVKKQNQKALMKFFNGDINCLISTSVIEEGVDIPKCSLVIRFDQPEEYRSYVQSKGRARFADSHFIMMVSQNNYDKFSKKYATFKHTEGYLEKLLVGTNAERSAPDWKDVQNQYNDTIPPYINPHNNARLSAIAAISLLNRYCLLLPHDQFTVIRPLWLMEDVPSGKKIVTLVMPISCPIKTPIKSLPMSNLKDGKRSAALNTCKLLHNINELDRLTMLPRSYGKINYDMDEVRECFPNWPWEKEAEEKGVHKCGSTKRVTKYPIKYPACLKGSLTKDNLKLYLHVIHLKAAFQKPQDSRYIALYNLLNKDEGYGFLTFHPLPKLCEFPMFLSVGEVTARIEENYLTFSCSQEDYELIKKFQLFIFSQVLEIFKKFTIFNDNFNTLFVVPIAYNKDKKLYDIVWSLIRNKNEVPPVSEPPVHERQTIKVIPEDYTNAVVTPWYRNPILPDRYLVSKVIEYLTPTSMLDSSIEITYEKYYEEKYQLKSMGPPDQPLLEVVNINSRMNCLLPRPATLNTLNDKQKKQITTVQGEERLKTVKEIFIPEYCLKNKFPGVWWYKAMILPSLIHRVTMLLKAEELRTEIAKGTNIGVVSLPQGTSWKPIVLNMKAATESLLSLVEPAPEVNTIDRINNPIDDTVPCPVNVSSMKENMYKLALKKLDKEYSWLVEQEPIDIDRNISTVTLMDVECYEEFISAEVTKENENKPAVPNMNHLTLLHPALLPPPEQPIVEIQLLINTPSHLGPELRDILAALTSIKSHDSFNLERAETLGDSFLKFISTLYFFHKFPKMNEGELTNIKGKLIGNRNLNYAGTRIGLGGRMKCEELSPRNDFVVPSFDTPSDLINLLTEHEIRPTFLIGIEFDNNEILKGGITQESLTNVTERLKDDMANIETEEQGFVQSAMQCYVHAQAVSDKTIADCVEALIGTYLLSNGPIGAIKFMEWMRILPEKDNVVSYLNKKVPTVFSEKKATLSEISFCLNESINDIESIIKYKFNDPSLLLEAMSHPSYIRNRLTFSYERLEFLGDAILDFLITAHIYEKCPDMNPGDLTDLRSALVNNVTFASLVVKLGLHKYLCYQLNPVLSNAIMGFVEHQKGRGYKIEEDVIYMIYEEDCHVAKYVEVPKALSDIFEALAGAIYLDTQGDLVKVWHVFYGIMHREIATFSQDIPKQPVRVLYENIFACPEFGQASIVGTDIPSVLMPVTITKNGMRCTVHGYGSNKSQAKRAAAKLALKILMV